jgi:phospholipid/cholesterol/gamma-HCH transport system substrate-binding protein
MNELIKTPNAPQSPDDQATRTKPMDEPFRYRHVHAITGTFILLVVAVLIVVVLFAGRSQRWFIGNVPLRIALPEAGAAGIRQGSEVYFLGTLMGTVLDVSVDPAGRMEALVNIRRDFFLFVRDDSSAVIKRKFGMVGDAYFEITRGHGRILPEKNASIVCNEQLPSALEAAVEEIRGEAMPALRKLSAGLDTWTELGSNLINTQERLDQFIVRADRIASDLQEGKGTAGKLMTDSSLGDGLEMLLTKANRSMDALQITLDNLQKASGNLNVASTNLPAISDALAHEATDLPGLVLQTHSSMRELERLTEAMQRHWILRRYVNLTNPPGPLSTSAEAPPQPAKVFRSPRDLAR